MSERVLRAEACIDDVVDRLVKMYQGRKKEIWILCIVIILLCLTQISQYTEYYIYNPISHSLEEGMSKSSISHAVALGVCSGLCAPGVRLLSMLLMAEIVSSLINEHVSLSVLAISTAINSMMTIPNLFIWKVVFYNIGSRIMGGGRYLRPFVAGILPWALSVPFLYVFIFFSVKALL